MTNNSNDWKAANMEDLCEIYPAKDIFTDKWNTRRSCIFETLKNTGRWHSTDFSSDQQNAMNTIIP